MNDKTENQVSTVGNTSDTENTEFGTTAFKLSHDTIEHVNAQLNVCLKNLKNEENRQISHAVSDTVGILQRCVKTLELLQQIHEDAKELRNLLPK